MTDWRYKTFRNLTLTVVICLLVLNTISFGKPDPHRFDPLLKTNWYGFYMKDMKIGYSKKALLKIARPVAGWRQEEENTYISRDGKQDICIVDSEYRIYQSPGGELIDIDKIYHSPTGDVKVEGHIEGDNFVIKINLEGHELRKVLSRPVDFLDSNLVAEMMVMSGTALIGDSIIVTSLYAAPPIFDKVSHIIKYKARSECQIQDLPSILYSVEIGDIGSSTPESYKIDWRGNCIEISLGNSMKYKVEREEDAKRIETVFDNRRDNLVKPDKKIENIYNLKSLTLQVNGIDSTVLKQAPMQQVNRNNDGFELKIKAQEPPDNSPLLPIKDEKDFLIRNPFVQSDDPQIIKLAKEIAAGEKDSWEVAKKINLWVYSNIKSQFTPSLSTAVQVLNSRKGDCKDHTVLELALLQAAGIPARPIAGLMYSEPGNGFASHVWVEAYVGRWIQMDPTWNENLANPTHIYMNQSFFLKKSIAVQLIDSMKISVIDVQYQN
jgi:hypothetical protein